MECIYLSSIEKAEIAYFLIHSLEEELDEDVEDAWDNEIFARMAEIRSQDADGESAEQVFSSLREKYA